MDLFAKSIFTSLLPTTDVEMQHPGNTITGTKIKPGDLKKLTDTVMFAKDERLIMMYSYGHMITNIDISASPKARKMLSYV